MLGASGDRMTRMVFTACLLAMVSASPAVAQVFRSGVETVRLGVAVVDREGQPVTVLGRDDFIVFEDGKRQSLQLFSAGEQEEAERQPLHIGLLFDTSGSMASDLRLARSAAVKFCNMLQRAEDITLVDFDTEVRVARFSQNDFPLFVERLRNRKPDGWTALYDALGLYLDGTSFQQGEKVMVAYTDGGDTRSVMSYSDALTALRASDVTIYIVGFLQNQGAREKLEQRMRLTQLAETTGGLAFFPSTEKEIDEAYVQVLGDINARYLLGYVSSNTANDGAWRKLDIRLTRPELKAAKVRARKGYFAIMRPDDATDLPEP